MSEGDAKKFLEILSASVLTSAIPLRFILKHFIDGKISGKKKFSIY
jgi:hypothetical protein